MKSTHLNLITSADLISELRSGPATDANGEVGLPRSTPLACWATLAISIIIAGTYSNVLSLQVRIIVRRRLVYRNVTSN